MQRSRTYSWADPAWLASEAATSDGLHFSRRLATATEGLTPIFATLGYALVDASAGHSRYAGEPGEHLRNELGLMHNGYAATLLDSAAATAIHTTIPAGTGYTTMGHTVHYLRPVIEGAGPLQATGTLVHRGRTSALAHVGLRDSEGRLIARATNTCIVLEPESA